MNDNNQLLQTAWQSWHAGTGIDVEDMPPPNPSFKAGFDYGMVAAHNEHCAALIRVEELSGDAKKMAAMIGIKDVLIHRLTEKVGALEKALSCATNFIIESPCDPGITVKQCVAYDLYQESLVNLADLRSGGASNEPK